MKKHFKTRLEAVDWIAAYAEDEAQFEILREQINFNFIYTQQYFVEIEESEAVPEVVWLGK